MLYARVAVQDHRDVLLVHRSTFGHDQDLFFSRRLNDPLAHVTPHLVVALDRCGALSFQTADVSPGVIEARDDRLVGVLGAVEDEAGGVDAGAEHQTGRHHLRLGEDRLRAGRRVEGRGHAVSEVRKVAPLDLRVDVQSAVTHVSVNVHQPRNNRLAGHVDHSGPRRDLHAG